MVRRRTRRRQRGGVNLTSSHVKAAEQARLAAVRRTGLRFNPVNLTSSHVKAAEQQGEAWKRQGRNALLNFRGRIGPVPLPVGAGDLMMAGDTTSGDALVNTPAPPFSRDPGSRDLLKKGGRRRKRRRRTRRRRKRRRRTRRRRKRRRRRRRTRRRR